MIRRPRMPRFYGWRIVGAGGLIQMLHSGLLMQAFGNYSVILRQEFGWSATMLAAAFSMTRAESGFLGPLQGWAIDRFGPRAVIRVGTVLFGVGFMLFSQLQNPAQFFGFYFLVALGSSLGGFLSITTAIVNWFDQKRSIALAVSQSGFAIGGLMTPLIVYSLTTFGWRETAFVSGIIVIVFGLPLSQVIHHRPEDIGEHIDGIVPDSDPESDDFQSRNLRTDFTVREALTSRAFWLISLGHGASLLVVGAVMVHLSLHLTESLDFSLQEASFVGGALPMMQLAGQLLSGFFGDRFNKRHIVVAAMGGHMVGLLLLAFATNAWMVWAFVPVHGLAWGLRGPMMQAMRADYFGRTYYGTIMGFSSMIVMLGMIAGPLVAGILRDRTDSYQMGFTILALLAGLGSIFFWLATPPPPPQRPDSEDATLATRAEPTPAPASGGSG
jgi:MFS family permease